MPSRSEMNKKPQSENQVRKVRKCLMCADTFQSHHVGERICGECKSTSTWRQTGLAIYHFSRSRLRAMTGAGPSIFILDFQHPHVFV